MWSKWIDIDTAVKKYALRYETIYLWIKLGKVQDVHLKDGVIFFNKEKFEDYLSFRIENKYTGKYMDDIEMLCLDKITLCDMYLDLLRAKTKEIEELKNLLEHNAQHTPEI